MFSCLVFNNCVVAGVLVVRCVVLVDVHETDVVVAIVVVGSVHHWCW